MTEDDNKWQVKQQACFVVSVTDRENDPAHQLIK